MLNLTRKKLLVIAPHPDDEIFGCGGLIHRVKEEGGKAYVLYLTVGTTHDFSKKGNSTSDERIREIEKVAKLMRLDGYHVALPGNDYHLKLDSVQQGILITEIERGKISLESVRPDILAFPSFHDYNQDHRAANEACITATRPVPGVFKHVPSTMLEYEFPYVGWSPTAPGSPNTFVALDPKALKKKLDALRLYKSQMKVEKGPISVYGAETLAHARGVLCGADAAEAFVLRRTLV
jgi:N-acetylglucosamine malate deacetylase 1